MCPRSASFPPFHAKSIRKLLVHEYWFLRANKSSLFVKKKIKSCEKLPAAAQCPVPPCYHFRVYFLIFKMYHSFDVASGAKFTLQLEQKDCYFFFIFYLFGFLFRFRQFAHVQVPARNPPQKRRIVSEKTSVT